jgi:hypothetical protein
MKNSHCWVWILIWQALAGSAPGQAAITSASDGRSLEMPTNDTLVLSNASGKLRVLDSKGLVPIPRQILQKWRPKMENLTAGRNNVGR